MWQWGVTIEKTIADRFSASKIVSDGRSPSTKISRRHRLHIVYMLRPFAIQLLHVHNFSTVVAANLRWKKMLIWTFVYDIRFDLFFFSSFFTHFSITFLFTHMRNAEKKPRQSSRIRLNKTNKVIAMYTFCWFFFSWNCSFPSWICCTKLSNLCIRTLFLSIRVYFWGKNEFKNFILLW